MCAYQGVNGVPMCSNGFILNRVVRESWGWKGFVVSDCDALNTMMVRGEPGGNTNFGHAYSLNGAMAAQDGARAGCDSGCSGVYKGFGMQAVAEGLITEKEVNASVRRLLRPHFELGLFDPIEGQPYVHLGWEHVSLSRGLY
jgi:beta-glucosidase